MNIKGGEFIGSGTYGCVFSPALAFEKDQLSNCVSIIKRFECPLVTDKNDTEFVSKIGTSIKKEFDVSKAIVERLHQNNVDAFDLDETPGFFPSQYIRVKKELFKEKYPEEYEDVYNGVCKEIMRIDLPEVDIIQIYKFSVDFNNLKYHSLLDLHYSKLFLENSLEKLEVLHRCEVYHFDIKPANLAIKTKTDEKKVTSYYIYFNDWDFAFIGNSNITRYDYHYHTDLNSDAMHDYYYKTLSRGLMKAVKTTKWSTFYNCIYDLTFKDTQQEERLPNYSTLINFKNYFRMLDCFLLFCSFPKAFEGQTADYVCSLLSKYVQRFEAQDEKDDEDDEEDQIFHGTKKRRTS